MKTEKDLLIGGHVSIAGGLETSLERIKTIGGNCMQIFSSSPRSWTFPEISDETRTTFITQKKELGIHPIFFHASYLVNLADNGYIGDLSKKTLIKDLEIAENLGIKGVILHTGSFKNGTKDKPYSFQSVEEDSYQHLIKNIEEVLRYPSKVPLILENSGTRKIGWNIDELFFILQSINNPRLKICLDTCHLHAAGYDLSTIESFNLFFDYFDKKIGLDRLALFHLNDSKDALGSFRDRHENIEKGEIPKTVFYNLTHSEKTKHLPFILEVPGFEKQGPDKQNILKVTEIASHD